MTISQEDARRAIELLHLIVERSELVSEGPEDLDDQVLEFLFDFNGDRRFEDRDNDPSPMCRCGECSPGNYTCISHD